jgi:hypothetical protein
MGDDGDDDATGGSAGGASVTLSVSALSISGYPLDATLLAPSQPVTIAATPAPVQSPSVRFALVGEALDASLDAAEADVDENTGTAIVHLTAPSTPAAFNVRVTTSGADPFFLPVAVPGTGMATVNVSAMYSGSRIVSRWTASAWSNKTCAELSGAPPEDGDITVSSGTFPVPLEVPAGFPLAVILRQAKYIWGCASVDPPTEGTSQTVSVDLTDVPIKLDRSHVAFELNLDPSTLFVEALGPARSAIYSALLGDASDEVEALLDAMQGTLSDPSDFRATRRAEKWDSLVRAALPGGSRALSTPLDRWISDAVDDFDFKRLLVGEIDGTQTPSNPPKFTVNAALGHTPSLSTFASAGSVTWEAQADDTVLIGANVTFEPGALLLGAATAPAVREFPDVSDLTELTEALSLALPCKTVADTLVAYGESDKRSIAGCDQKCTEKLCRAGVSVLFSRTSEPANEAATLAIALTGGGGVGDDANLTALGGTWIGKLTLPPIAAVPPATKPTQIPPISLGGPASARDATPSP